MANIPCCDDVRLGGGNSLIVVDAVDLGLIGIKSLIATSYFTFYFTNVATTTTTIEMNYTNPS
jgi:hypothetical protein